jgi:hypothetical protein
MREWLIGIVILVGFFVSQNKNGRICQTFYIIPLAWKNPPEWP